MSLIDDLLDLEHRGWHSLCDGTGGRFYGELMTEDAVMVLVHGFALTRPEVVDSLSDAPTWDSYEIADERLVPIDADAAALVYTGRGIRAGDDPFVALMASSYARIDGAWRLVLHQQTSVARS